MKKRMNHPVALMLLIVAVVVVINIICSSIDDNNREKTKQLACQVKLEQFKLFGTTNVTESIVNKK